MTIHRHPHRRRRVLYALLIAFAVLCADQISKILILGAMQPPRTIPVIPMLSFDLVWNRGVTFGLLTNHQEWTPYLFAAVAVTIIAMLLRWLWRADRTLIACGIGLIIGGAVGNVIDRFRFGAVVDFIHVSFYPWVFNVADSAVVVGVGLLMLESLLRRPR